MIRLIIIILIFSKILVAQQYEVVKGEVVDSNGATVVNAKVTLIGSDGMQRSTSTNNNGLFIIKDLTPGSFVLKVSAENFKAVEITSILVQGSGNQPLKIILEVQDVKAVVDVSKSEQLNLDSSTNSNAIVLNENDLDVLPDNPDEIEAALRALAGNVAGPDGGQIYVDGIQGGRIPTKESIQEIRINSDPFSSEYESLGFGRIEIFTKPGSSRWRGQTFFNFNDDALNARNPFAANKADRQLKYLAFYLSGPLIKNKASISLSSNVQKSSDGTTIFATILNPELNIVRYSQEFNFINNSFYINPRLDYRWNDKNDVIVNYSIQKNEIDSLANSFSLPSQLIKARNTDQTFQFNEVYFYNPNTVNELKFYFRQIKEDRTGDNKNPLINVQGAFIGGGAPFSLNSSNRKLWQIQNITTTLLGKRSNHNIKFGGRFQGKMVDDRSDNNFNGTINFVGFVSPVTNNPYDLDRNGIISSIEQFRAKVLGETDPLYNPSQLSLTTGDLSSKINQYELSLFIKDEWRINSNLVFSSGLRYENQTNINDNFNLAPRVGFAFSPFEGKSLLLKSVIRGGVGIFYSRFSELLSLEAKRLNGITQRRFIVTENDRILGQPVFSLNEVRNLPTADQLNREVPLTNTLRIIDPGTQSPYSIQGALNFEKQLPKKSVLTLTYIFSRNLHFIRSRNINAPLCQVLFSCPINNQQQLALLRPNSQRGDLYLYESSRYSTDQRMTLTLRSTFGKRVRLTTNYVFSKSQGISDSFPFNSYDLTNDFGFSSNDIRHSFGLIGTFNLPFGIVASPLITARSGLPFNIITGTDLNGDSIYTDRPTFFQLSEACQRFRISKSWCNTSSYNASAFIPWNFGRGPSRFAFNLSVQKTFSFTSFRSNSSADVSQKNPVNTTQKKAYSLTLGARFANLFNTNNKNNPVGNINSPIFGQSTNSVGSFGQEGQGGRTIDLQIRFTF